MAFLSGVASYICIVNLLKHELVGRCDMVPLGIQEEYFSKYSVTGPGNSRARALASAQAIGNAVVALIFSMAKREVTFLSETLAISRL